MLTGMNTLTTVDEIVEALGGNQNVADLFGVLPTSVSNWKAFGGFPERLHLRLFQECQRRNITIDPAVFERNTAGAL